MVCTIGLQCRRQELPNRISTRMIGGILMDSLELHGWRQFWAITTDNGYRSVKADKAHKALTAALIKLRNDLSETVGTRVAHSRNSDDDDVLYDDDMVYIVTVKLPVEPAVFQLSPALSSLPYADTYTVTIHASQLMQRALNYQASASLRTSADALICYTLSSYVSLPSAHSTWIPAFAI